MCAIRKKEAILGFLFSYKRRYLKKISEKEILKKSKTICLNQEDFAFHGILIQVYHYQKTN